MERDYRQQVEFIYIFFDSVKSNTHHPGQPGSKKDFNQMVTWLRSVPSIPPLMWTCLKTLYSNRDEKQWPFGAPFAPYFSFSSKEKEKYWLFGLRAKPALVNNLQNKFSIMTTEV